MHFISFDLCNARHECNQNLTFTFPRGGKINSVGPHRSSRSKVFCKKGVLRNLTKFTGKHLCQGLFFNKVAGQSLFFNKFFK